MDVCTAPNSIDVEAFQFKLQRRVHVFKTSNSTPSYALNLIAAASRFGLLFVGTPENSLHVFQIKSLILEEGVTCPRRVIPLPAQPVNLSLNCTQDLLCIVYNKNNSLTAAIYDAKKCASENLTLLREIRLNPSPGVQLCRLLWNPCQADTLAVCTSDGNISVYQCKQNSIDIQSKVTKARSLSWSPKGKQIVTGNIDGTLSQFKPDLTLVKTIPAPHLFGGNPSEAIAIHWISNYQFSVVFRDTTDPDNRPCVTIINTPKVGTPSCINYEDICYSMGNSRSMQYYLTHFPTWGVLLASSANSVEVGVLGTADQNNWQQWIQADEARAELPLTDDKQENYPIGVTLDDAAIHQLPWGENSFLPHMPMMHILSHTGTLVSFYVLNITKEAAPLCSPPEEVVIPQHLMTLEIEAEVAPPVYQALAVSEPPPNLQQDFSFAIPPNAITSTPTIPKSNNSLFNVGTTSKPVVTNLFGVKKDPEPVKPLMEAPAKPLFIENKPQSPVVSNFAPSPNNAFSSIKQEPNSAFVKPQSLSNSQVVQQQQHNLQVQNHDIKQSVSQQQEDDKAKVYEAIINQASNDTIKGMLLKEMNEFQVELYELLKKCRNIDTKIGTPNEMNEIISVLDQYDKEPLEDMYSNDDVKHQINLLKHCLVKMCSVLIEAKLQPESLELEQLAQLDPVSASKMTSIKKTMYYVENQLKQVSNVLDDQWNTFQEQCKKKINALQGMNSGYIMTMPTLDKVYQPLVKHQDILVKQQSTVKALQKLLENIKPQIYSTKIGRPLTKAYKDSSSLSTLTKNLLNLSLQPSDIADAKYKTICEKNSKFSVKKQNALREMLANRHVVKIKPIKVEPPHRLQSFFDRNSLSIVKQESPKTTPMFNGKITYTEQIKIPEIQAKTNQNITKVPVSYQSAFQEPTKLSHQVPTDNHALSSLNKFVSNITIGKENTSFPKPSVPVATLIADKMKAANEAVKTVNIIPSSVTVVAQPIKLSDQNIPANVSATSIFSKNVDVSAVVTSNTFMGQNICSPVPKTIVSGSLFGSTSQNSSGSTTSSGSIDFKSDQAAFVKPIIPKTEIKTVPFTSVVTSASAIFKPSSFTSPATSQATPTNKPDISQDVQKTPVTFNFGSLSVSKTVGSSVPSSTPIVVSLSKSESTKPIFESQSPGASLFGFAATSIPSSAPAALIKTTVPLTSPTPTPTAVVTQPVSTLSQSTSSESSVSPSETSTPTSLTQAKPTTAVVLPVTTTTSSSQSLFIGVSSAVSATSVFSTPSLPTSPSVFGAISTASSAFPTTIPATTPTVTTPISTPSSTAPLFGTTPSLFSSPVTTASVFTSAAPSPATIFGGSAIVSTSPSSVFGNPPVSTVSTTSPFGGSPSASSLFASANANMTSAGNMFESLSVTPPSGTTNVFGSPTSVTTCASSIFGAANAAVPSTVTSLFGSTSISSTSAPFGSSTNSGGSIFGGSSTFGGPSTFSQPGASVFGGGSSAFGQPQTNIFGGNNSFGSGFGSPPSPSVFGQAASGQPNNIFGGASSPPQQGSVFGTNSTPQGQTLFGSPSTPVTQSSIFGSPSAQSSVFGGAANFGARPVFGQSASFGSSPPGAGFGSFSSGDQQNVAQAGFGSPSAFSRPPGYGSSQSATFENLATQSTLTFGNLAQQTQQPQPAAPVFQGNPSFSSWRS